MKILIDGIAFALQKVGGVSTYWLQLIPAMAKAAPDARFYITVPSRLRGAFHYENIIPLPLRFVVPRRIFESYDSLRLSRVCRKYGAEIFHSTYFTLPRGVQVPRIVTVYDMIYEALPQFFPKRTGSRVRKRMRQAIVSADAVITISESTKESICSHYNISPELVRVVYPGVSPLFRQITDSEAIKKFRTQMNLSGDFLLYVGKREGYKNFATLLSALAQVKAKSPITLLCVGGEKRFSKAHTKQTQMMSTVAQVRCVRNLKEDDLILAYNSATALVYPSLCEGFGLPLIEAMACGTPVIASDIPVLRESCGAAALFANPQNPSAFVNSIEKILGDQTLRRDLTSRGLDRAKLFSWETAAHKTLQIYSYLLNDRV